MTTPWRRPRGQRRIPPARLRAVQGTGQDPYGPTHRAVRKSLLALLAATGPWPCPLCGQPMHAGMGRALHLHHSNPQAKLAGLPGDQLAHGRCNVRDGGKLGAQITNSKPPAPRTTAPRQSRVW